MAFSTNPALNKQMMQLEQEYTQKRNELMQSFYAQTQSNNNNWNHQSAAPMQNVNWIQVSGIDGAKNQIVQQGHTAWMMDNNAPYFYVKSVDNVGRCEFHVFQFTEVQEIQQEQSEQPQIDLSQYVQRDEFERLREQLEQFTNELKKQPVRANKEVESDGESINGANGETGTGKSTSTRRK